MNEVSEGDISIQGWSLLETSQLAWMDEIVQDQEKLKVFADDFLNELT